MKNKFSLLGMVSLASLVLATTGGVAYAADGQTPVGDLDYAKSDVKVKIQVPNINDTDTLAFDEVPANFDFGFHEITGGQTNVENTIALSDSKVSVYKDYARDDSWRVKANVSDLSSGSTSYEVSSFRLNNKEIAGTGANAVLLESVEGNNGVGTYSYGINTASINFKLPSGLDQGISNLTGNVFYTLEVTASAE